MHNPGLNQPLFSQSEEKQTKVIGFVNITINLNQSLRYSWI